MMRKMTGYSDFLHRDKNLDVQEDGKAMSLKCSEQMERSDFHISHPSVPPQGPDNHSGHDPGLADGFVRLRMSSAP
jgi:hypothetical protein